MNADDDPAETLACGTSVAALTAQVMEGRPPPDAEHQATCQHCRATIAELSALFGPLHALVAERLEPPRELIDAILAEIRELDYVGDRAVVTGALGATAISVRVIAAIARRASDSVPGALFSMSRAGVEVGAVGRSVVVALEIVAALGLPLPPLSERIRRVVREHVEALTGLRVVAVDVCVVEVAEGMPEG